MLFLKRFLILALVLFSGFNSQANLCAATFTQRSSLPWLRNENIVRWEKTQLPTELVPNKTIETSLDYVYLKSKKGTVKESDLFTDTSDLILGIDTNGNTRGHVYMIVNNKRVDGHILYTAQTETHEDWSLSKGLFIRIKGLPEKNKQKLLQWAQSEDSVRGMTCVAVACKILFKKANLIKAPKKDFWFPSDIFEFIVDHGLYGHKNKKLDIEIYTLNQKAEDVLANLPTWNTLPKLFFMLFDPKTWGF